MLQIKLQRIAVPSLNHVLELKKILKESCDKKIQVAIQFLYKIN